MSRPEIQELYEKHISLLLPSEQLKLAKLIISKVTDNTDQTKSINEKKDLLTDWEKSQQWIAKHQQQYQDQWVALSGNRLLSAGTNAKEVYDSAVELGVTTPFLTRILSSTENKYYFGGW